MVNSTSYAFASYALLLIFLYLSEKKSLLSRLIAILWILLVLPLRILVAQEDLLQFTSPLQLQVTAHKLTAI
jgi:hypothetical protein